MARSEFSLYKKFCGKRAYWYARFWNYETGRFDKYRSTGVRAKGARGGHAEADRAAREMLEKKKSCGGASVAEYVSGFWDPGGRHNRERVMNGGRPYSASYLRGNLLAAKNEIAPYGVFQKTAVGELTAGMLRDFRLHLHGLGKSGDRINKIMQALSVPLHDARERGDIKENPAGAIKPLRAARKEKGVLTDAEIEKIKSLEIGAKLKAAVFLGLFSGLRLGEIRGLMRGDIGGRHIDVRHNWQTEDGLKNPKYDSFGKAPLGAETKSLLEKIGGEGEFFFAFKGRPACYDWFCKGIQKVYCAIGVSREEQKTRRLTFHSLRHTFATISQTRYGLSPVETMSVLRHKSGKMTERYTHPSAASAAAIEKWSAGEAHEKGSQKQGGENAKTRRKRAGS